MTEKKSEPVSVSDAVARRMSVRAFLPDPVAPETVRRILEKARRAPSGGNVQPWQVHVLSAVPLQDFVGEVMSKLQAGERETPEYDVYPPGLWEPHRTYRFEVGEEMYGVIGLERENKLGRMMQLAENFRFFRRSGGALFLSGQKIRAPTMV